MTLAKIALLSDRGVVHVTGDDAETFLQGLVTSDVAGPAAVQSKTVPAAVHAGLLSPQGKILFEFFVVGLGGGFLLGCPRPHPDLIKRRRVAAREGSRQGASSDCCRRVWVAPLRRASMLHPEDQAVGAGVRWLVPGCWAPDEGHVQAGESVRVDEGEYHAHRIALGVPEGGKDYAFGDTFPHEANFDVLNGVSFTKGCFVGQEVVSRMQHRGTARKRIVIIEGEAPLRPGGEVMAGDATIGKVGSVAGNRGLALVRLDRAEEATRKGGHLTAGGSPITLRVPDYLQSAQPAAAQ
jgi:folate-binding protein YgfZ